MVEASSPIVLDSPFNSTRHLLSDSGLARPEVVYERHRSILSLGSSPETIVCFEQRHRHALVQAIAFFVELRLWISAPRLSLTQMHIPQITFHHLYHRTNLNRTNFRVSFRERWGEYKEWRVPATWFREQRRSRCADAIAHAIPVFAALLETSHNVEYELPASDFVIYCTCGDSSNGYGNQVPIKWTICLAVPKS